MCFALVLHEYHITLSTTFLMFFSGDEMSELIKNNIVLKLQKKPCVFSSVSDLTFEPVCKSKRGLGTGSVQ